MLTDGSLLKNGKYSDFVIVCGSDTYDVHKSVVCARSGFFEQAERFPVGKVCGLEVMYIPIAQY
jgi:hypothetical protein